jgi:hypothetical protein
MAARSNPGRLTGLVTAPEVTLPAALVLFRISVRLMGRHRSRSISFAAKAPEKRLNILQGFTHFQDICFCIYSIYPVKASYNVKGEGWADAIDA